MPESTMDIGGSSIPMKVTIGQGKINTAVNMPFGLGSKNISFGESDLIELKDMIMNKLNL